MSEEEILGRLNGLSLMIEMALVEITKQNFAPVSRRKGSDHIYVSKKLSLLLHRTVSSGLPAGDFLKGTCEAVQQAANRVEVAGTLSES